MIERVHGTGVILFLDFVVTGDENGTFLVSRHWFYLDFYSRIWVVNSDSLTPN